MSRVIRIGLVLLLISAGLAFIPIGGAEIATSSSGISPVEVQNMDLAKYSAAAPGKPLRALFIHHSCGGQLLAPAGASVGEACIYESHPNGGNLRARLRAAGYEIHEASYGSVIGENTEVFDWAPKFRDQMDLLLTTDHQDRRYTDGRTNQIVVFKSCFTSSRFVGEGEAPGNAEGPDLSLWNAKAALMTVRDQMARRPDVLFIYVTAPPLAPKIPSDPLWKWAARRLLRKPQPMSAETLRTSGVLARRFNEWVTAPDGWLADYHQHNVVVFDYFGILTEGNASGLSRHASRDGTDSHPSAAGNERAALAFETFINRAVRRAALVDPAPNTNNDGSQTAHP